MLASTDLFSYLLRRTGWSRFVSTFLFFYSQIIVTEFILGLFSILTTLNLVIFNLLFSFGLLTVLNKKFGKKKIQGYRASLVRTINATKQAMRTDPLWSTLIVLATGFLAWIVFLGIIFPSIDFDGNSYHLTFIAYVMQNHNFYDVSTSIPWLTGYPKGGEFIQMWSMLITHNDMFTDLTQIPFLFLGVYALYEISVTLGASKKQARFSALLFFFLPIVLNQLKTTYVDVMLCSVFFAAIAIVIKKQLGKLDLILVGILFSLLISIKSTGFLFVFVVAPLLLWNVSRNLPKKSRKLLSSYVRPALLVIAPMFFGLYWYIKNLILHGSPLYPFGFKVGGHSIFPGKTFQEFAATASQTTALPHSCVQRVWFVWTEQKDWFGCLYNYDSNYTGFGPLWFIILLPALFIAVYFAIKKRNILAGTVAAIIAALFAVYPANYYSRYTIFVTLLGIVGLAIALTNVSRITTNFVKSLTLVLVLSVIATNFVLCNYPPRVVVAQIKSLRAGDERGAIYSVNPGKAYVFIENKIQPGEVITYDSKPFFIYPLWRTDYADKVTYVNANTESAWYAGVQKQHVKYVFTMIPNKENKWAKDRMTSIYKDDTYEIFQAY